MMESFFAATLLLTALATGAAKRAFRNGVDVHQEHGDCNSAQDFGLCQRVDTTTKFNAPTGKLSHFTSYELWSPFMTFRVDRKSEAKKNFGLKSIGAVKDEHMLCRLVDDNRGMDGLPGFQKLDAEEKRVTFADCKIHGAYPCCGADNKCVSAFERPESSSDLLKPEDVKQIRNTKKLMAYINAVKEKVQLEADIVQLICCKTTSHYHARPEREGDEDSEGVSYKWQPKRYEGGANTCQGSGGTGQGGSTSYTSEVMTSAENPDDAEHCGPMPGTGDGDGKELPVDN